MRHGGGHGKGANFEREVCKKLSLWVSKGKRQDLFWRSAMSGGRATLARKKGEDLRWQAGDICAVHPSGHDLTDKFYIECKFYRDLDMGGILFGKGKLFHFWVETVKQAEEYNRKPMLIAKQNHGPVLVLTRGDICLHNPKLFSKAEVWYGDEGMKGTSPWLFYLCGFEDLVRGVYGG